MRSTVGDLAKRGLSSAKHSSLSRIRSALRCAIVAVVRRGRLRFFLVKRTGSGPVRPTLYGEVTPLGRNSHYAILTFSHVGNRGRFCQVEVPRVLQRKGLAEDMVHALMKVYPDSYFWNVNLNERSGPLFMKMSKLYPDQIAPIAAVAGDFFSVPEYGRVLPRDGDNEVAERCSRVIIVAGGPYRTTPSR